MLVLFPNSDLRTAKLRPALVVQANDLNTGLQQVLVAMISSKLMRANHPSRIFVSRATSGRDTGLLVDSVVMTDNIATILLNAVARVIRKLSGMREVEAALRHTLGL